MTMYTLYKYNMQLPRIINYLLVYNNHYTAVIYFKSVVNDRRRECRAS